MSARGEYMIVALCEYWAHCSLLVVSYFQETWDRAGAAQQ